MDWYGTFEVNVGVGDVVGSCALAPRTYISMYFVKIFARLDENEYMCFKDQHFVNQIGRKLYNNYWKYVVQNDSAYLNNDIIAQNKYKIILNEVLRIERQYSCHRSSNCWFSRSYSSPMKKYGLSRSYKKSFIPFQYFDETIVCKNFKISQKNTWEYLERGVAKHVLKLLPISSPK